MSHVERCLGNAERQLNYRFGSILA